MVGQQDDLLLVDRIPHDDASQVVWTLLLRTLAHEPDDLIRNHVAPRGHLPLLDDLVQGVGLEARDEDGLLVGPPAEKIVVVVASVNGNDGTGRQVKMLVRLDVVQSAFRDGDEAGHVVVVIEQDVELDAPLLAPVVGPREQGGAQRDRAGVEREQLVLEPELGLSVTDAPSPPTEVLHALPEEVLEQLGGPVVIGVRECGFVRLPVDPQMLELSVAARKSIAYLAQGVGMLQMAELHRHELSPARESLGMLLSVVFGDELFELASRHLMNELTEQTCRAYHVVVLRCVGCLRKHMLAQNAEDVIFKFLLSGFQTTFWTRVR